MTKRKPDSEYVEDLTAAELRENARAWIRARNDRVIAAASSALTPEQVTEVRRWLS